MRENPSDIFVINLKIYHARIVGDMNTTLCRDRGLDARSAARILAL